MWLWREYCIVASCCTLQFIINLIKKRHAAKSAQERRRTNYNMRAHPGRYITAATAKAAVSPTKHFNT
jgi:hypothetical protein